jgi:hypothetical protein
MPINIFGTLNRTELEERVMMVKDTEEWPSNSARSFSFNAQRRGGKGAKEWQL